MSIRISLFDGPDFGQEIKRLQSARTLLKKSNRKVLEILMFRLITIEDIGCISEIRTYTTSSLPLAEFDFECGHFGLAAGLAARRGGAARVLGLPPAFARSCSTLVTGLLFFFFFWFFYRFFVL